MNGRAYSGCRMSQLPVVTWGTPGQTPVRVSGFIRLNGRRTWCGKDRVTSPKPRTDIKILPPLQEEEIDSGGLEDELNELDVQKRLRLLQEQHNSRMASGGEIPTGDENSLGS